MKNGELLTNDSETTITIDSDTELIAVFNLTNTWDGPSVTNINEISHIKYFAPLP